MKAKKQLSIPKETAALLTKKLPDQGAVGLVAEYLQDEHEFQRLVSGAPAFFPKYIREKSLPISAAHLAEAVCRADLNTVLHIVNEAPHLLFVPPQTAVSAPCGQRFHKATALQLILYYLDWDMLEQVTPFILPEHHAIIYEQSCKMQYGGPDLVKMGENPQNKWLFSAIEQISPRLYHPGCATSLPKAIKNYKLLENHDGIVFCNNQFFYANRSTRKVSLIQPRVSEADTLAFEQFRASFDAMVDNSSRKSSTVEHALITRTLGYQLQREGILYEKNGHAYQDTWFGNDIVNAYRKYNLTQGGFDLELWKAVGVAQREVMHILQRFCERNHPLNHYLLESSFKKQRFDRTLELNGGEVLDISRLGVDYMVVYQSEGKKEVGGYARAGNIENWFLDGSVGYPYVQNVYDLCRFIEIGKNCVAQFIQEIKPKINYQAGAEINGKDTETAIIISDFKP